MDVLAQLASAGVVVLNSPRAVECAVDKYLTTARLVAAGLRVPRTAACQGAEEAMEAFRRLGGDVVVKPLFGGEGRGITRVADPDLAWRAFHMLQLHRAVIYLQEFIPHHGFDIRLFLVGERLLAMRRINPLDWRTNVSRGARTEAFPVDDELVVTARQAAASVGATLAGVDVLPGLDGQRYVIEVNAVPGWKALARTLDIDVAQLVLQHLTALIDDGNVQL
jgi:ribosomal protein S6--L-glutamate ligase